MKSLLKQSTILNKIIFYLGWIYFSYTGKTPKISYMAMINLYCLSNGNFLKKLNQRNSFTLPVDGESKLFKNFTKENLIKITDEINNEGYKIFQYKFFILRHIYIIVFINRCNCYLNYTLYNVFYN